MTEYFTNLMILLNEYYYSDPDFPVQATAAASLRYLIKSPTCSAVIEPILQPVLIEFMRLMKEIPVDDLVCSLETIIDRFGPKILPFADQLVGQVNIEYIFFIVNTLMTLLYVVIEYIFFN
tara:strand:+ start:358 stop:720 length:363 start_codon:yes stop_codon:yes gene_type:complete